MGLDFSIEFEIYHKTTGTKVYHTDIAYWRKNWGMVHDFLQAGMKESNHISDDWDYKIVCNENVLDDIIDLIMKEIPNDNSEYWTNSVFSASSTRHQTIMNLANLISLRDWIESPSDDDCLSMARYDIDENPEIDEDIFDDILENIEDYEFRIIIINSY